MSCRFDASAKRPSRDALATGVMAATLDGELASLRGGSDDDGSKGMRAGEIQLATTHPIKRLLRACQTPRRARQPGIVAVPAGLAVSRPRGVVRNRLNRRWPIALSARARATSAACSASRDFRDSASLRHAFTWLVVKLVRIIQRDRGAQHASGARAHSVV
jgi:hypothetical protein